MPSRLQNHTTRYVKVCDHAIVDGGIKVRPSGRSAETTTTTANHYYRRKGKFK